MNVHINSGRTSPSLLRHKDDTASPELYASSDAGSETPLPMSEADTDLSWSDVFSRASSPLVLDLLSDALEERRFREALGLEHYTPPEPWADQPGYFDSDAQPMRTVQTMPPIMANNAAGRPAYEQAPQLNSYKALHELLPLHALSLEPLETIQKMRPRATDTAHSPMRVKRGREIESDAPQAEVDTAAPSAKRPRPVLEMKKP